MTAIVMSASLGIIFERRGGLSAGSRPISWRWVMGRGPVVGEEPVQRINILEVMVKGSWDGELILMLQLPDFLSVNY